MKYAGVLTSQKVIMMKMGKTEAETLDLNGWGVGDFQLYDISLVAEDDLSESDDYIKVPIGDETDKIQWDTCNFRDDPLAFVKHTYPDGVPTLHEYQKQFLQKIAESMVVPWLCRKS